MFGKPRFTMDLKIIPQPFSDHAALLVQGDIG
jgi:hypothetical protein